jgi:anti-sigma factor RsiW
MNPLPVTDADLHAWVDGLLPVARRDEIEEYLRSRPAEAERLNAYVRQKEELRSLFNPVADEPVPQSMSATPWNRRTGMQRIAAALIIALASGASGWALRGQMQAPTPTQAMLMSPADGVASPLAHQAAIAHVVFSPEVRRPVEVGADQEDQLVTWLSKRLGTPIHPPKLGKSGYELIGGRLLPGQRGPVAQFMYQNAAGQRLTLYVSTEQTSNRETGFRFAAEGPVNVFYWIDRKFGYALSGSIGKKELAHVATVVYEQLGKS